MKKKKLSTALALQVTDGFVSSDLMVDLETLGKSAGCQILSIGACFFNRTAEGSEAIGKKFYAVCRTRGEAQGKLGLRVDESTMRWWEQQSAESRTVLKLSKLASALDLSEALLEFSAYMGTASGIKVWGCGSDFDCSILYAAYDACKLQLPWSFWNSRCYRTLKSELKLVVEAKREGVYHNALDDAVHQAKHAAAIFRAMSAPQAKRGIG